MAAKKLKCPICGKSVHDPESPYFPFCSHKCKLVDLEAWLGGRYHVPGEPVDTDQERTGGNGSGRGEPRQERGSGR